jgi:hypothetical protein
LLTFRMNVNNCLIMDKDTRILNSIEELKIYKLNLKVEKDLNEYFSLFIVNQSMEESFP